MTNISFFVNRKMLEKEICKSLEFFSNGQIITFKKLMNLKLKYAATSKINIFFKNVCNRNILCYYR